MKILQQPFTNRHKNAMFFDGKIFESDNGEYSIQTFQDGEVGYNNQMYAGKETIELREHINDEDLEREDYRILTILVDKFFCLAYKDKPVEEEIENLDENEENLYCDYVYCDYDEALQGFKNFLEKTENNS